ncbi:MAG: UDP-N-acetylmuramoyl-tripeptide--D-alanyl-D-alanine ligase [Candidatus Latescibacterota bacterium]
MEAVSLGQIQQWTGARTVGILGPDQPVTGVSTDTRTLAPGEVFVALRGERCDGHRFVQQALSQGAAAAVVEEEWAEPAGSAAGAPLLVVDSSLAALGAIARGYRRRFALPVVGVVGSAGKTTTKEMIAAVLGRRYRVLKNQGNENNEVGVPRTLLQLDGTHQVVVLEMAARKWGDIAYLCSIAQPTIGVLLNFGTAHLGFFGSVEGVAKAKGELLDYLDESCTALTNVDDCVVAREAKRTKGRLLGFSLRCGSQYRGEGLVLDQEGCGHFSLQNHRIDLQVPGRHNVYNALAAAAVGDLQGVPWSGIQEALHAFQAVAMRSQVTSHGGVRLIDDSYNANPDSVEAALDLLGVVGGQRRLAVLGDMLELGAGAAEMHARVGRRAAALQVDLLLATGPLSQHTVSAARQAGLPAGRARHFADREALGDALMAELQDGDVVLVKASRGMSLDQVARRIAGLPASLGPVPSH